MFNKKLITQFYCVIRYGWTKLGERNRVSQKIAIRLNMPYLSGRLDVQLAEAIAGIIFSSPTVLLSFSEYRGFS